MTGPPVEIVQAAAIPTISAAAVTMEQMAESFNNLIASLQNAGLMESDSTQ